MRWTTKLFILLALLVGAYWSYAQIATAKKEDMSLRQQFIRAIYPVIKWASGLSAKEMIIEAPPTASPNASVYDLRLVLIDGDSFDLATCKGKKILFVNTASDCGFTPQYEGLQALHEKYGDQLIIIGFPSNDFKEQEKKNDSEIASFCKRNYGVTFLLASKASVRKGPDQHPIFKWLSDPQLNGWNNKEPSWNFSKYLVDENGRLTHFFEPGADPNEKAFADALLNR